MSLIQATRDTADVPLQPTVRDLAALAALPAIWISSDLPRGLQNVGEVLGACLRVPLVYVRVVQRDGTVVDAVCTSSVRSLDGDTPGLRAALKDAVDWSATTFPQSIPSLDGKGPYSLAVKEIAIRGKVRGTIAAFSTQAAFPGAHERLLLSTSATQVALLLQRHEIDAERLQAVVSEQKAAQKSAEVAERLRVALDAANLGDWSWDMARDRVMLSARAAEILDLPAGIEPTWRELTEYWSEPDRDHARSAAQRSIADGSDFSGEYRLAHAATRWVLVRGRPTGPTNSPEHRMVGVFQDVTERKRTEVALRSSHDQFATLINHAPVGAYLIDRDLRILQVNATALPAFGAINPLGTSLPETLRKIWPGDTAAELTGRFQHTLDTGEPFAVTGFTDLRVDSGQRGYFDWQLHRVLLPDGTFGVVCYFNDVTAQVHAKEALQKSESRFRFMADSVPQKIFTAQPDGKVDYLNHEWAAFGGPTTESLDWLQFVHSDDRAATAQSWESALAKGEVFQAEHRFRTGGGVERWHLTRAHPMRDSSGNVLIWIGSSTDMHDQKTAEERLEQTVAERTAQLRDTIEELESFSYSISHDMRAPLRAMQSFAQILQEECGEQVGPIGREYVRRIVTAAERMDRLVQDVLTYSRVSRIALKLESVDLASLLNGILEGYPQFQSPNADITVAFPLPRVDANPAALTQVLSNVIGNAVKFVAPGVTPRVRVWAETRDGRVVIHVRDNGIGIDPSVHEKIFGIFYRLSRDYDGTGIGLAVARRAAERMGGKITLDSTPGKGSTFSIELRAATWEKA